MSRPIQLEVLPAPQFSDGDHAHRPTSEARFAIDTEQLLMDVGFKYMLENVDFAQAGKVYTFESLPDGYAVYGQTRSNSTQVDKYIYGHPSHRIFRSIDQFIPHLEFLILNHPGSTCGCVLCGLGMKKTKAATTAKAQEGSGGGEQGSSSQNTPAGENPIPPQA